MINGFEEIDHTADVGLRVFACSLDELVMQAARGMLHLMLEDAGSALQVTADGEKLQIAVEAETPDELLHVWLSELLFQMTVTGTFPVDFTVETCTPSELRVLIDLVPLTKDMAAAATEIKAVTWHGLSVEQTADGWQAQVIFDT
ncbi:MAG: archease [Bacteroidetes bacterium]|nr:archease [Bacteroidota bacterium]